MRVILDNRDFLILRHDIPSRRIVLVTKREKIPIPLGYFPDHGDVILDLSARLRALLN